MTKKEMQSEINFPIYGEHIYNFVSLHKDDPLSHPCEDSWILCLVDTKGTPMVGIYKWQKENNPKNITGYTYINIHSNNGSVRYVEYPHWQDDKVILICNEKDKDLIIHPREKWTK